METNLHHLHGKLDWLEKHQKMAAMVAAFLLFLALNQIRNVTGLRWDSATYWKLSSFTSLSNFPGGLRGYFYPFLLSPARFLSDILPHHGLIPYRVISSLAYAFVFTNLLPDFYSSVFGGRVSFWRRLCVPVLVALLLPGIIVYPLSDLPAMCLMLGSAICILHSANPGNGTLRRCELLLFGGILGYGAYNTRTIYLFPLILLSGGVAAIVYRHHPLRGRALWIGFFIAGILLASIPQMLINEKNYGEFSPFVATTRQDESLFTRQLLWGIAVQRYEAYTGRPTHGPRVFYVDTNGEELLANSGVDVGTFNMVDYFKLAATHPFGFAAMYARHVVNGLDLRDGGAYSTNDSKDENTLAVFNFLIIFCGFVIMVQRIRAQSRLGGLGLERVFWAVVALLPVLMVIPGAIETRFFLVAHICIYSVIAYSGDLAEARELIRKDALWLLLAFALSATLFFSVSLSTMASVQYTFPTL